MTKLLVGITGPVLAISSFSMTYPWTGFRSFRFLFIDLLDPQQVHQSVGEGCEEDRDRAQEDHPTEDSVGRSEKFGGIRWHWIHRAHAGKDERSVINAIDPIQLTYIVIARYTDAQGDRKQEEREERVFHYALGEFLWR